MRYFLIPIFLCLSAAPALALDVNGVRFGTQEDRQRVVIELSGPAAFKAYILKNPDRLTVDLPKAAWKVGDIRKPVSSAIDDIRHGDISPGRSRLVFQTRGEVSISTSFALAAKDGQGDRIVIDFMPTAARNTEKTDAARLSGNEAIKDKDSRPRSAGTVQNLAARLPLPPPLSAPLPAPVTPPKVKASKVAAHAAMKSAAQPKKDILSYEKEDGPENAVSMPPASSRNGQKPLIIIDPGHGGQDPGAHAANGNYEKTIVLAVGLELKKKLEASGQYRVQMTRDTDVFIPLKERVNFARRNGGDLFVSLHADSMPDKNVTGASVYTLSDTASDKEAEKLAERENKSDAIAGVNLANQDSDVANILIDLASRDTMNQSRYLANTVVSTLPGKGVDMLRRKPHRSAGFAVLKAMDIPSILVEMGYLTNMEEANRLSTQDYRARIAQGLKASVDAYFMKVARLSP